MAKVAGILIGHGQFAQGLHHALRLIVGEIRDFEVISTEGVARTELEQIVGAARKRLGDGPLVVFTDLFGGCGGNVCGSLLRDCSTVGIICGVNLPMLVKFSQYRDELPLSELCDALVQTGHDGIRAVKRPSSANPKSQ